MKRLFNPQISFYILSYSLGGVLIAHSLYLKMVVFTLPGTAQFFAEIGLPEILAYIVFIIESIAGAALLLGFHTRFFTALIIPVLLGATLTHLPYGWLFTNSGGGWEYPLFLSLVAIALLGLGDETQTKRYPFFIKKNKVKNGMVE